MNQLGAGSSAEPRSRPPRWGRRVTLALLILLILAAASGLGNPLAGGFVAFAGWLRELGPWGPAVFIGAYTMAVLAFVPASLMTLAAGALFGIVDGTLYVFAAACVGSWLAFLLGRYVARDAVERRILRDERYAAIDAAVAQQGRKIVFLLRLSPAFPFNLLNYALGLTRIRFSDYAIASVGMLPATLLYVYSGRLIGDVAAVSAGTRIQRSAGEYALLALGAVATLMVVVLVTRIARRALDRSTALINAPQDANGTDSSPPSPDSKRELT